mmetsp:Transcript_81778/g.176765  ORF Transcript_81778/g.176765 Transcript_81778/m.176765 type:complete len:290 (-) Transcript_81778:74-943(-)
MAARPELPAHCANDSAKPGFPWGGRGTICGAMHDRDLATKGRCLTSQEHQKRAPRRPQTARANMARADPVLGGKEAQRPQRRPQSVMLQRVDAGSQRPDSAALICASRAMPSAGLATHETLARYTPGLVEVPTKFNSDNFVAQLECPAEVRATPLGDAPDPPKLKKTAPDEIRGDFSAAEQRRRGCLQSAVYPGPMPPPDRPHSAAQGPRGCHPRAGFKRGLWHGTGGCETAPVGVSVAWSSSPRFAPVRLGSAAVRMQRISQSCGPGASVMASTPRHLHHWAAPAAAA